MRTHSWIDDEPRVAFHARQVVELLSRGSRRPWLVVCVTALSIGSVLVATLAPKETFAPQFVLRVIETERDPSQQPRPKRQLAEYVKQAVFTSEPLLGLIGRYGLYASLAKRSPRAALETFREDIEVEAYQNYFVEERSAESAPRSARLSVSYRCADREIATSVTRDLGALVVQHERAYRKHEAERAAAFAKFELDRTAQVLESRRAEIAAKSAEVDRAKEFDPKAAVELANLVASLHEFELREMETERREGALALGAAIEARGLGLSFEVVDDGSLPARPRKGETALILAGASLILGLPLVIMAVGAFDSRRGRA